MIAYRLAQTLYQLNAARLGYKIKHPFALHLNRSSSLQKPTVFSYNTYWDIEGVLLKIFCRYDTQSEQVQECTVTIEDKETTAKVLLLSYNPLHPEQTWLYQGVWCDLIEDFLQLSENMIDETLREWEKRIKLPSLFQ